MRKNEYYARSVKLLGDLKKDYPNFEMGRHIATAFSDYGDLWGLSDKEFLFALERYKTQLELDSENIVSDDYVEQIMKDAEDLTATLTEEEEENDGY